MEKIIWGIDPGSAICGVCELRSGVIGTCFECEPKDVYNRIMSLCGLNSVTVVIEDIFPYSTRLKPEVIETCKWIGEFRCEFRKIPTVTTVFVPRNTIKNWVFDTVPEEAIPRIKKKIVLKHNRIMKKFQLLIAEGKADPAKPPKGLIKLDGEFRQPSFQWVDDRIVIAALKTIHGIPTPKPGKRNIHGLSSTSHGWQAMAVATFWQKSHGITTHTANKISENNQ